MTTPDNAQAEERLPSINGMLGIEYGQGIVSPRTKRIYERNLLDKYSTMNPTKRRNKIIDPELNPDGHEYPQPIETWAEEASKFQDVPMEFLRVLRETRMDLEIESLSMSPMVQKLRRAFALDNNYKLRRLWDHPSMYYVRKRNRQKYK